MKYCQLKAEHRSRIEKFPMAFAFNERQFHEGLEKLGATKDEIVPIPGGGFIKATDQEAFAELFVNTELEMAEAMKDDEFMIDAIRYELNNHEFCYTGDPSDAMRALGLDLSDDRVREMFKKARELAYREE